jgi:hypothetical protein
MESVVLNAVNLVVEACELVQLLDKGSRVKASLDINDCKLANDSLVALASSSGYRATKIDNGAGIGIKNCAVTMGAINSSSSSAAGITVDHGRVDMVAVVAGTSNTGAGVYAFNQSLVTIKDTFVPTITGTVGNLAVADPAVVQETWANIAAGDVVSIAAEMTLVKEVA